MIFSPNQNKFLWYCNTVEKEVLRPCGPPAALSTVIGSHNSTFAVSADTDFGLQPYSRRNPRKSIRTKTSEVFSGRKFVRVVVQAPLYKSSTSQIGSACCLLCRV